MSYSLLEGRCISYWKGLPSRGSSITLQGTNISQPKACLKMIFLFPRWDILVPWGVVVSLIGNIWTSQCHLSLPKGSFLMIFIGKNDDFPWLSLLECHFSLVTLQFTRGYICKSSILKSPKRIPPRLRHWFHAYLPGWMDFSLQKR